MKRIALLGATGSIGRQALEIIDAHPELELCAAASGSQPIDGLAPLTQVGGDLTELLERAEPDLVLNAVVGFAGLPATLWALERGVDLALANKESLVAAGELALDAQQRGGGRLIPVDSEHSAAFQCLEGRSARAGALPRADRLGRPVPRPHARRARGRDAGRGAGAPDLEHGPEDHDRLRDAREQGARADRGALPLRPAVRADRGRRAPDARSCMRSFAFATVRRSRISAIRTCACRSRTRSPIRSAAATPIPPLDLAAGVTLEFEPPDLETFPLLALARRAGEQGGTYPCVFNAANEVAVAAFLDGRLPFLGIADVVADALGGADGAPARDLDELVAADEAARRHAEGGAEGRMSILIAILGLAVLILLHEAGHFFVARARRHESAPLLSRFPAGAREGRRATGIEYGIGAIPLGGYVKIPGMHRPAASDLDVQLGPALKEDPSLFPKVARVQRALEAGDLDRRARGAARARAAVEEAEPQPGRGEGGAAWRRRAARRAQRRRLLAPAHLEAHRRHLRRPGHEHPRRDPAHRVCLPDRRAGRRRPRRSKNVKADTPAAASGCARATRSSRSNGRPTPDFDAVSQ